MSLFNVLEHVKPIPQFDNGSDLVSDAGHNIDMLRTAEMRAAIDKLAENQSLHFYTKGAWSSHQLLASLLLKTGPAKVWLTSWSLTEEPLRAISALIDNGFITGLKAIFDYKIDQRKPESLQLAKGIGIEVALLKCHAKMIVIQNDTWGIAVSSSANLTRNPRLEAGVICSHRHIAEFHKCWIENEMANG